MILVQVFRPLLAVRFVGVLMRCSKRSQSERLTPIYQVCECGCLNHTKSWGWVPMFRQSGGHAGVVSHDGVLDFLRRTLSTWSPFLKKKKRNPL